jgi:hypothetical protein
MPLFKKKAKSNEPGQTFTITLEGGSTAANDLDAGVVLTDTDRPFVVGPTTGGEVGSVIVEFDLTNPGGVASDSLEFLSYDWRTDGDLYDEVPEEVSGQYDDAPRSIIEFGSYRGHDRIINWQEIYIGPTNP